jgi:hypothetical protein
VTRDRPTAVLVLAILHLVGGCLGLVFGAVGLALQLAALNTAAAVPAPAPSAVNAQNFGYALAKHTEAAVPSSGGVQSAQAAVGLLLDVLLLNAGVGLLFMRRWARTLSLAYAALSIHYHLFGLLYAAAFLFPASSDFLDKVAGNPGMGPMVAGWRFGWWAGILLAFAFILYPIVVLVVLLLPGVAAAFRAGGRPEAPAELPDFLDADRPFRPYEPPSDAITR